ncbi:hypothetical protein ACJX0J_032718 [Zea mays]
MPFLSNVNLTIFYMFISESHVSHLVWFLFFIYNIIKILLKGNFILYRFPLAWFRMIHLLQEKGHTIVVSVALLEDSVTYRVAAATHFATETYIVFNCQLHDCTFIKNCLLSHVNKLKAYLCRDKINIEYLFALFAHLRFIFNRLETITQLDILGH